MISKKICLSLLFLCLLGGTYSHAQTKQVSYNGPGRYMRTEGSVLAGDKNKKHGNFRVYFYKKVVEEGTYENNRKTGVWHYRSVHSDEQLTYDHTQRKVMSNSRKMPENLIGMAPTTPGASLPIPLISQDIIMQRTAHSFRITPAAVHASAAGTLLVGLTIGPDGTPKGYRLIQKLGYGLDEEALRVFPLAMEGIEWHPAQNAEGENVEGEYIFPYRIVVR
jgi:hypothetical protein